MGPGRVAPRARGPEAPPLPLESEHAVVRGVRMHARVATRHAPADAPAVVLVHGLGVSSRYMIPLAERLASFARVYAPDLPGFGKSDPPPAPQDTRELARTLAAWVQARRLESATFVGNSYGCEVIAELALAAPDLVERAVLVGSTTDARAHRPVVQILRWMRDGLLEPFGLLPVVFRDYLAAGPRRCLETYRLMLRHRIEERLPRLHLPVLVVRGARDPIAPQAWAEEMVRLLPHAALGVVPGAAHAANFSAPLELARMIRPFLSVEPPADCEICQVKERTRNGRPLRRSSGTHAPAARPARRRRPRDS